MNPILSNMKKPQIRNRDELLRRLHHALDAGDLSDPVIGDVLSNGLLLRIADEVKTRRETNDWYVPTGKPRGVAPHKGDIVRAFAKDHPAWSQRAVSAARRGRSRPA